MSNCSSIPKFTARKKFEVFDKRDWYVLRRYKYNYWLFQFLQKQYAKLQIMFALSFLSLELLHNKSKQFCICLFYSFFFWKQVLIFMGFCFSTSIHCEMMMSSVNSSKSRDHCYHFLCYLFDYFAGSSTGTETL